MDGRPFHEVAFGDLAQGASAPTFQEPLTAAELARVRHSVVRGTPYGEASCMERAARRLGLESTLRPRGRPRQAAEK